MCVIRLNRRKTSTFSFRHAGGQRMASRRWPMKLVMSWEAVGDVQLCTCISGPGPKPAGQDPSPRPAPGRI